MFIQSSLSFDELAQHFRSADLVVYPSYYEGQGLIPLESLASGTGGNSGPRATYRNGRRIGLDYSEEGTLKI